MNINPDIFKAYDIRGLYPSELNEESSPDNLKKWDSLAAMDLVAAIEEKFSVQLSTKEIMKMNTIGRARKTLQGKGVAI